MRWTERQLAMLREMGVRLEWRELPAGREPGAAVGRAGAAASIAGSLLAESRVAGPAVAELRVADKPAVAAPHRDASSAGKEGDLRPADWLFVGEALAAGGDEAQLLDNMLRAIGVSRSAPERAKRAALVAIDATAGLPLAVGGEGSALRAATHTMRPRCIVALGRVAASALLGRDDALGALRGHAHDLAGVPVVVTFALPFLLRHPAEKAKAWADLCLAVRALEASPALSV